MSNRVLNALKALKGSSLIAGICQYKLPLSDNDSNDVAMTVEYGMSPAADTFLDILNAADRTASDINERLLMGYADRRSRANLLKYYLPPRLKWDPKAIKAGLILLDDMLSQ